MHGETDMVGTKQRHNEMLIGLKVRERPSINIERNSNMRGKRRTLRALTCTERLSIVKAAAAR